MPKFFLEAVENRQLAVVCCYRPCINNDTPCIILLQSCARKVIEYQKIFRKAENMTTKPFGPG